jgi:hypothetical protein
MGHSEAFRKHAEECRQNARMAPNADGQRWGAAGTQMVEH